MLYGLVRPMKRPGSSIPRFVQRILADVRPRAVGRTLDIPLGNARTAIKITAKTDTVRFSLRSRDPAETKIGQGRATTHLETVWQGFRRAAPVFLTNRDAPALTGQLYRAWAEGRRESDLAATFNPDHRAMPKC